MKDDVLSVKETVEDILKSDERSRSDDKWLVIKVLQQMGFKVYVPFEKMDAMPSFESITRVRRLIQATGLYPPSPKVAEERKEEETKMRKIEDWF